MKKKNNLIICILYILESICLLTPFCIDERFWKYDNSIVYHGLAALKAHNNIGIMSVGTGFSKFFGVILILFATASAVLYLLSVLSESEKFNKIWILSIAHTVILVIYQFYVCGPVKVENITWRFDYKMGWMFYVVYALNIVALVLSLISVFGKTSFSSNTLSSKPNVKNKTDSKLDSLDELIEYKKLLDLGVLTQEEFDNKKAQLLKQ